jgi:ADP-ribosylglycohydrolase
MLGLLLGDALAAAHGVTTARSLVGTGAGQLACFTVDALIRDDIRAAHRGVAHQEVAVWAGYRRWGQWQGMLDPQTPATPPDGWLATVPVLGAARARPPSIVAALRATQAGTLDAPAGSSTAADAVTLTLPVGIPFHTDEPGGLTHFADGAAGLAAQVAALAHRDEAVTAAAIAAAAVVILHHEPSIDAAVRAAATRAEPYRRGIPIPLDTALDGARADPFNLDTLRRLAPDPSAGSALAAAVFAAASAHRDTIADAVRFAAAGSPAGCAAPITGALLGAAYGPEALPADLLTRLELSPVGDALARDLIRQLTECPAGTEFPAPTDEHEWEHRYPDPW